MSENKGKVQEPLATASGIYPLFTADSPSASSQAVLRRRLHLSTRLGGRDGADVGICTTEAKIYHI